VERGRLSLLQVMLKEPAFFFFVVTRKYDVGCRTKPGHTIVRFTSMYVEFTEVVAKLLPIIRIRKVLDSNLDTDTE
jgi:hypothetical protein